MISATYSSSDFYPYYRDTDYVNTSYGPIAAAIIYAPAYGFDGGGSNLMYAKLGGYKSNMTNYAKYSLGYTNTYNVFATRVIVELISTDYAYRVATNTQTPTNGATSVSLSIPIAYGQSIPVEFTMSSTTVSQRPATGSPYAQYNNIVKWDFYRAFGLSDSDVFFSTSSPQSETSGFAGKSEYVYANHVSSNNNVTVGAQGKITYTITTRENSQSYIDHPYTTSTTVPAATTTTIVP